MRINKEYPPELQRDLRDIKQRLENLDVSGGGGVTKAPLGTRPKPVMPKPIPVTPGEISEIAPGTVEGDLYINGTLLVGGSEPLYGDCSATYVVGSRAIGTIYQNTDDVTRDVRVSIKCE